MKHTKALVSISQRQTVSERLSDLGKDKNLKNKNKQIKT